MKLETMQEMENYLNEELELASQNGDDAIVHHKRFIEAAEALRNVERDQNDFYDKQEKRRIEEEKNQDSVDAEREKSKIGWKRMTLEILKIFGPVAVASFVSMAMQKRAGVLEETGRWTTEAGRQAHRQTPNIWNK